MPAGSVAQAVAAQHEFLRPKLEELALMSNRLWARIKKSEIKATSDRPSRIPFEPVPGGKFRVANLDGGNLGRGSAPNWVYGDLSTVPFVQASEYTALSEYSTDSSEKAIENYVSKTHEEAVQTIGGYFDAVMQGNGSNQLDTVVSTVTGGIVVNNANYFQNNQDVDIWTNGTGTGAFVGTVTILTCDINNSTIWLTGAVPGGTATGYALFVSGSSGQPNAGLFGLRYYQQGGNAGNYMGIQRSSFPGMFSTTTINLNGSLTPASVRALESNIKLAIGIEKADKSGIIAHCNVDVESAWENNSLLVQRIDMTSNKSDNSVDMLKPNAPRTIAGREVLTNERAAPGLLDFLALEHWFRLEVKALDFYEVAGQTVFPIYGQDGGLATSMIFYMVAQMQIGNGQPRAGAYMSNINIPKFFFGH